MLLDAIGDRAKLDATFRDGSGLVHADDVHASERFDGPNVSNEDASFGEAFRCRELGGGGEYRETFRDRSHGEAHAGADEVFEPSTSEETATDDANTGG